MSVFLPKSVEDAPLTENEVLMADLYCLNENEKPDLRGNKIVLGKIDMRDKSREERAMAGRYVLTNKVSKKSFNGGFKRHKHSHKERINEAKEISTRCAQLPHISRVYLVGSTALGADRDESDIDIAVVRESCPGYKKCGKILKRSGIPVDLLCCTEGGYRDAEQKQFLILSGAKLLYAK